MDEEFKKYLLDEEKHIFKGWDFSYLKGRWLDEPLPWSYNDLVMKYLRKDDVILDMGTGDGSLLLSFNHPFNLTHVTEAYEPNIELCLNTLKPKGISVYPIKQDDILLNVENDKFDLILNHHESYLESEIKRVLKKDGIFITQQVGAQNNNDLATFFDSKHQTNFPEMVLSQAVKRLMKEGFEILYQNEFFPKLKFFDLGAIVYFAKIITWEFTNFSVLNNLDKLDILKEQINRNGYIESTEHRYIIIARKVKE